MAEKETNNKTTTAKTTAKATAKPAATTAPKTTVTAKPAATTAPKTTVTTKPAATTAPKTAVTAKPAATTAPKTTATAKPATMTAPKTTATAKPAATTASKTTAKPTAAAVAASKDAATPKSSLTEETAAANAEKPEIDQKAEKPAKVKKEKPVKEPKAAKEGGSSCAKAKVAAIVKTDNFKIFGIIGLSLILVLCLCLGLVFGLRSCAGMKGILRQDPVIVNSYKHTGLVGHSSQTLGTVDRYKPVEGVHDGGLKDSAGNSAYPTYGSTKNNIDSIKGQIIRENNLLNSANTTNGFGYYTWMDKDGKLFAGTRTNPAEPAGGPTQLYKHTGSIGLYLGDVSDDEKAVIKKLTFRPRSYTSYYDVTGVYAPAGEVIKIQMSDEDMKATKGISVHIGQALYNGKANNIWSTRALNRMPVLLNTMLVNENTAEYDEDSGLWTAYVGSFLGGPIYVRDESVTFSVTVSGGVPYSHFILGVTTEEEFNATKNNSVPYFDLEVWDKGVLHSGPKRYAQQFSYEDLYKAAILWEKVSIVTTTTSNQGIVFLYDPFVAAGAAVAFPGQRSVNCPMGWMTSSLNYNAIVTSGSWGNFHEYHHNFQNYGVGDRGEVTNNGLTLVSYSLFTNVSSARQVSGFGGAGLSGWNQYTSAPWALNRVNTGAIGSTNGLAVYATLLHNLGQDAYIQSRGVSGAAYWNKFAENTHQDMSYYADKVKSYGGSYTLTETDYPLFVPVSSVYQTGRTYNYDGEKREINTMQPFVIPYGKPYTFDLNPYEEYLDNSGNFNGQYKAGSVVIGDGFKYTIKEVKGDNLNGSLRKVENGVYEFTPNSELRSGKIYVTLEISTIDGAKEWNGHRLDDVDLVIEFQQSHETNKAILERTTYYYAEGQKPTDAVQAYESNYAGYERKNDRDHSNPTQNCNTDIWYCTTSSIANFPKADPELAIVDVNSIDEVRGKLYFPEAGKYNIYLRGRKNCAMYYSLDGGKTYQLGVQINATDTSSGWRTDKYVTLELEAESWVYFKEILINGQYSGTMTSFIGLGIGTWTTPMYNPKLDSDGNTVTDSNGNPVYIDQDGNEVSAEQAANAELIAPKSISYATAYRQSYEFKKEFESDYFYTKQYNYTYKDNLWQNQTQELVSHQNYSPYDKNRDKVEHLVDGNKNTYIHTNFTPSENKPLEFVVDMGEVKPVNRMTIYTQYRPNGDWHVVKVFTLYGSVDGEEFFEVYSTENAPASGGTVTVNFDEKEFRYYKLVITGSFNKYVIITEIEMWRIKEIQGNGNNSYSPDNGMFTYKGDWKLEYCNSNYGHIYVGKNATVEFEFDGKRFALIASKYYGRNYEVYVDGELLASDDVKEDNGDFAIVYMTPELTEGKHKVTIYCPEEGNIDAFVTW